MGSFSPQWEDRGFRSWMLSRYSAAPMFATIIAMVCINSAKLYERIFQGSSVSARIGRAGLFVVCFTVAYLVFGYGWYRYTVRKRA